MKFVSALPLVIFMGAETILDIILGSIIGLAHLGCITLVLVWRRQKFSKGIHDTAIGCILMSSSFFLGVFLPIGGFTFLDGGQSGTRTLIFAAVICPLLLVFSLRSLCFCIFIEGNSVVERILFRETRIVLNEPGASILLSEYFGRTVATIASQDGMKVIRFDERHFEGDVLGFIEACKSIQRSNGLSSSDVDSRS